MKQKNVSFLAILILAVSTVLFIYSCSSDEYDSISNSSMEKSSTQAVSNDSTQLIDLVSKSDDFLDFRVNCMDLAEKLKSYTSTLTLDEFDELMNNLNNDDYMIELLNKVDLKENIFILENSRNKLLKNEVFFAIR